MSRITRNHKKYLNIFENDLLMIHRGDADLLADIYERDIMNDEARLVIDALLAIEVEDKPASFTVPAIETMNDLFSVLIDLEASLNAEMEN